jgi:hypothetical protein
MDLNVMEYLKLSIKYADSVTHFAFTEYENKCSKNIT